jgi:TPR repeat protein
VDAIWRLGECYANGRGVAVDLAEARALFSRAAELGSPKAQSLLARCKHLDRMESPCRVRMADPCDDQCLRHWQVPARCSVGLRAYRRRQPTSRR